MCVRSQCEKAHKKPMVSDLSARLSDDVFLNKLQKDISVWKSKIRSLTSLDRDVSAGSVLQEISFWLGVERAVNGVIQQLQSRSIGVLLFMRAFCSSLSPFCQNSSLRCFGTSGASTPSPASNRTRESRR